MPFLGIASFVRDIWLFIGLVGLYKRCWQLMLAFFVCIVLDVGYSVVSVILELLLVAMIPNDKDIQAVILHLVDGDPQKV